MTGVGNLGEKFAIKIMNDFLNINVRRTIHTHSVPTTYKLIPIMHFVARNLTFVYNYIWNI